jgi:hypothetical protein
MRTCNCERTDTKTSLIQRLIDTTSRKETNGQERHLPERATRYQKARNVLRASTEAQRRVQLRRATTVENATQGSKILEERRTEGSHTGRGCASTASSRLTSQRPGIWSGGRWCDGASYAASEKRLQRRSGVPRDIAAARDPGKDALLRCETALKLFAHIYAPHARYRHSPLPGAHHIRICCNH